MSRVSRNELDIVARMVNSMLEQRGSSARVITEARYDYHALDLGYVNPNVSGNVSISKTLRTGRTGELMNYLRGMIEAMFLLEPPYTGAGRGQ
jgi:hypothetical protein